MTCAVLCIGGELTRGERDNVNATWIASGLTDLGFEVVEESVVDDDRQRIVDAIERLGRTARVVIATGGLGCTGHDVTAEAVARALSVRLVRHEPSIERIRRRMEKLGRAMSELHARQADFPEGAEVLANPIGTAPGFALRVGGATAFFMPGVPVEMQRMFDEHVAPRIRTLAPSDSYQIRLRSFGLPESTVGERLAGAEGEFPGVTIRHRADPPEIEVKVLARAGSQTAARALCERATADVRRRLNDVVYGEVGDTYAGAVGRALRAKGYTFAIAESCTGGLVGTMITSEPGAGDFLLLDAVTYANSAKTRLLGVSEDALRGHGAVSAEVTAAMAEGVRHVSGADIALALTGYAGPRDGGASKPVGTVFIAVAGPEADVEVKEYYFPGDRLQIQTLAAYAGLHRVRELCRAK